VAAPTTPPERTAEGPAGRAAVEAFAERGGAASEPAQAHLVALIGEHAPALLSPVLADPTLIPDVLTRPLGHAMDERSLASALHAFAIDGATEEALMRALRRFRHRAVTRIALREVLRLAGVEDTSAEMAHLASVVTDAALVAALAIERARHGRPLDDAGNEVPITALGMGKLGGLELNLGSDIDLVFFYETDDARTEKGMLSVHEFFGRVVRRTIKLLSAVTDDGFCFRVDLRLRPEGSRGPPANSLASAESYYESWGRTWERAALLRARPIAGDRAFGARVIEALTPFVYRRAVDPSLGAQMNEMLLRARRELCEDEARDVKLGRGGIREAEFFVQTLQLVWGGRHPELRVPGTLEALTRLRAAGLVMEAEARALEDAWALLRRVEHRIHVRAGYQTHAVPQGGELESFAHSLGYASGAALTAELDRAKSSVAKLFASLLPHESVESDAQDPLLDAIARGTSADELAPEVGKHLAVRDAFEAASHLTRLARRANAPLGPVTRERLPALGRLLLREIAGAADPDTALLYLADFFTRLGGPWPYERLLLENPRVTRRLIGLFGASGTLSSALVGHPEDVDFLLASAAPSIEEIAAAHDRIAAALEGDPDPEALVAELRRQKRELTLQIGLAYVGGEIELESALTRLSELAEGQVRASLRAATLWAEGRWGKPAGGSSLVVCAMGKLGSRELGFAGDLDLVFLYGEDGSTERSAEHAEVYARVAQRTMMLLRQRDREGAGYETDTRLRPSGSKGTLVVSLAAFDAYHERGAAAWERQSLLRARPVAGAPDIASAASERFVKLAYLGGATPPEELAHARARIQRELAGETSDRYHPKLGYGALTDVEFLVQWLQMRHGADERMRTPSTQHAIAAIAAAEHLSPSEAEVLRSAYAFFRAAEQRLKLWDEHREPMLEPRGKSGEHVARALGLRGRDGMSAADVLDDTYRRHASAVRALFSRAVAPIDAAAPWDTP
jgi:glutamate-ammonia-ligase adenylyltransferase